MSGPPEGGVTASLTVSAPSTSPEDKIETIRSDQESIARVLNHNINKQREQDKKIDKLMRQAESNQGDNNKKQKKTQKQKQIQHTNSDDHQGYREQ